MQPLLYSIPIIFHKNFNMKCQQISKFILINDSDKLDFIHIWKSSTRSRTI